MCVLWRKAKVENGQGSWASSEDFEQIVRSVRVSNVYFGNRESGLAGRAGD